MKFHPDDMGLVVYNRDLEASAVSVSVHGKGNLGAKPRFEWRPTSFAAISERRA